MFKTTLLLIFTLMVSTSAFSAEHDPNDFDAVTKMARAYSHSVLTNEHPSSDLVQYFLRRTNPHSESISKNERMFTTRGLVEFFDTAGGQKVFGEISFQPY